MAATPGAVPPPVAMPPVRLLAACRSNCPPPTAAPAIPPRPLPPTWSKLTRAEPRRRRQVEAGRNHIYRQGLEAMNGLAVSRSRSPTFTKLQHFVIRNRRSASPPNTSQPLALLFSENRRYDKAILQFNALVWIAFPGAKFGERCPCFARRRLFLSQRSESNAV